MLLPDDLGERGRPQAIGERRVGPRRVRRPAWNLLIGEQVSHRAAA
jgi:hypothetical protein